MKDLDRKFKDMMSHREFGIEKDLACEHPASHVQSTQTSGVWPFIGQGVLATDTCRKCGKTWEAFKKDGHWINGSESIKKRRDV